MAEQTPKFQTERTSRFRASGLDEHEARTISHIENSGCSVLHVKDKDADRPHWSYTVGVFDTCGQPEIITVGLTQDTAHTLLNNAARGLRNGTNLREGRHREMVGDVECEFRSVDPKWVKHLMGWAIWYYRDDEFPVLQAVYPDRENRFPEDPDFDTYFRQPLLQPDAPMTVVEKDFWASNDPSSSLFDWKFPDPPHTRVFLSRAVNDGEEDVTYVSHDADDGAWQFLGDSMSGDKEPVISCFHHPIDRDPSLRELADLPLGWWAERAKLGDPWIRTQHDPEDESED